MIKKFFLAAALTLIPTASFAARLTGGGGSSGGNMSATSLTLDAGDLANLALKFSTNTNTGFYRSKTWNFDERAFTIAAGGQEILTAVYFPGTFDTEKMVGIGTRFPQNALHVVGGITLEALSTRDYIFFSLLDKTQANRMFYGWAEAAQFGNSNSAFVYLNGNYYPKLTIDENTNSRETHIHVGQEHSIGDLGFGPTDIYASSGAATLNVYGSLGVGNDSFTASSVPANGIVVRGQAIFKSSMTLSGARPVSETAPTSGQALIWNGSSWTPTDVAATNWVSTATSNLNMANFGIFNVSTNSWTCTLLGGVTYYWQGFPARTDTKTYLFSVTQGTVTASEAVTDGARFGGTSGSTNTWTARNDFAEMRLSASASPSISASVSGEIAYDTTDGVGVLSDGTTTYAFAYSTQTYSVTIASTTGAGSGGWDSLSWPIFNTPVQVPISIQSVWATVKGGTSVIYNLDIRPFGSLGTETGTDNVFSSSQTATTSGLKTTVLNKKYCAPGSHIVFKTPTSASSGNVDSITLSINYTEIKE